MKRRTGRPTDEPTMIAPVVLIQEIMVWWTKASRGAPGAAVRRVVPQALPLPAGAAPAPEPAYVRHVVRYDEANRFQAPLSSDLRVQELRGTIHEHNIAASLVDDELRVDLAWGWGAPMRHPTRGILALAHGEWGRVRFNHRSSGYDDPWRYALYTFNIGLFEAPPLDVFASTEPVKCYSNMADLW